MIDLEEQQRIVVEIFEITGYKVLPDDPVVVASLFYSEQLRTISQKHEKRIQSIFDRALEDMDAKTAAFKSHFAAEVSRATAEVVLKAASDRKATEKQFLEMINVAKISASGEVPAIKRDIERFVADLKRTIAPSENGSFKITLRSFCASLTLSALASFLAASIWFNKIDLAAWVYAGKPTVEQAHDAPPQAGNAATGRGKR